MAHIPAAKDKLLFTPGPLTTSMTVKQAMVRDLGSRDAVFIALVRRIRRALIALAGGPDGAYDAVIMQGSGTFGVESMITSVVPRDGRLLVMVNGAYGTRMVNIAHAAGIPVTEIACPENQHPSPAALVEALNADPSITTVAVVHHETTTGILNPVGAYGAIAHQRGKTFLVDAMSSFGGIRISPDELHCDALVSSSNKCIEGVPGFAFVLIRPELLAELKGRARSLSLDLYAQWEGLQANGQFRFTPPIQAMLAFEQALTELEGEGGIAAREERYRENNRVLRKGMQTLGFKEYLPDCLQGPFITSYLYPADRNFVFQRFYERLSDRGFVIYPGKLSATDCFRIGNIGRLFPEDMHALLAAIREVLHSMNITPTGTR